ncbi:hypothetical protein AAFC00_001532 [Neodothiora populina]|uniref:Chitin-binding type-4 domain-containing protein n=1 Tax=Neodothiora populina TaxID=2781224 RepID=A0ABR3PP81_9PEZI
MKYTASALAVVGMAASVHGHGFITSPTARMPGSEMQAGCGQQVFNNQKGDNYGNIQGELQVAATQNDYDAAACNIWLCKGYKYKDNTANVQTYTAGQKVDFKFDIRAPHTGVANVSIVNTATNSVIGSPLASWDVFASNSNSDYANQTSFSITIPSDLGSTCSTAGACVIQHYWDAHDIDQTYESCVDFTVGGSGSGSDSASVSSVAANTQVASSTAAISSSSSAAATSAAAVVSAVASQVPTAALSSTITASATGTAASSMKPIPSGLTLGDLLEWIDYLYAKDETTYNGKARRHARSFRG